MSFVDDPNKNSQSNNVAGSAPLSQDGSASSNQPLGNSSDSNQVSGTSSSIESGDTNIATSGNTATNSKSGKASSGMFTNIQKYVNKNRPQAQKMSGAATQDFSKQAEDIRKATEKKKQDQQTAFTAGTNTMNAQTQQAQGIVQGIMNAPAAPQESLEAPVTEPVQQAPLVTDEQISQYQGFLKGPNVADIDGVNLAKEQNRMKALEGLAASSKTSQGRRNLLNETFGDRKYTRGQSALDDLILSGDKQAREGLVNTVNQEAQDTSEMLSNTVSESQENLNNYQRQKNDFSSNIANMGNTALDTTNADVDNAYNEAITARQALLQDPENPDLQAALAGAQGKLDQVSAALGSSKADYTDYLKTLNPNKYSGINEYDAEADSFAKTGKIVQKGAFGEPDTVLEGVEAQKYLDNKIWEGMNHHKNREALREVYGKVNADIVGTDEQNLYGLQGYDYGEGQKANWDIKKKLGFGVDRSYNDFKDQLAGLGSAENIVQGRLARLGGGSYEDLASGADINKYETSKDSVSKINALKKIMGQEDLITDEQTGDGTYTDMDEIMKLLKGYSGE